MGNLYDDDILVWSEHQADLLRRRAAGERANDKAIDWSNIIEEIEDVGRSELRSVESLLVQALRHMLKAEAWPLSRNAPKRRADVIDFRRQAQRRFAPSMRQRIDVAELYADALAAVPESMNGLPPLPIQTANTGPTAERGLRLGILARTSRKMTAYTTRRPASARSPPPPAWTSPRSLPAAPARAPACR
jgi:Domain of unknown function DUF29